MFKVKRLGKSAKLLGWTVTHHPDGAIGLSQPNPDHTAIENAGMIAANITYIPYKTTK